MDSHYPGCTQAFYEPPHARVDDWACADPPLKATPWHKLTAVLNLLQCIPASLLFFYLCFGELRDLAPLLLFYVFSPLLNFVAMWPSRGSTWANVSAAIMNVLGVFVAGLLAVGMLYHHLPSWTQSFAGALLLLVFTLPQACALTLQVADLAESRF